jgi:hypothetical protein
MKGQLNLLDSSVEKKPAGRNYAEGMSVLPLGRIANPTCDGCNKPRKTLYIAAINSWDDTIEVVLCYPCIKKDVKALEKDMRDHPEHYGYGY